MQGPLAGVTVLDFTQYLAGPVCTRAMAEMGADVIKVELAPKGDQSRVLPFMKDGRSAYFVQLNIGKKSLCLDLRRPEALDLVKRLLPQIDVLVENFSPGAIGRLGLGPWEILILMQLSYLLMGTFLDDTAMLDIVAPLYVPLVGSLGFDLVWYGVLYTITCQIAYMTPPFGYNLFLMRAMAPPDISIGDIYRSIIPFVLVMILALAIVTVFPQIALWLPTYVYSK